MFVTRSQAAKYYGVTGQTIAKWADSGRIESVRQPSGQRRYWIDPVLLLRAPPEKRRICYCRVSSSGQKDDLCRQVEYMRRRYPGWDIVTDIGSGLNWKRKGLKAILRLALQGNVSEVVVAHRDRLSRFGFELIEFILEEQGVRLLCDARNDHTTREQELVEDIISIVTVFSAKIHGARKYGKANGRDYKNQIDRDSSRS